VHLRSGPVPSIITSAWAWAYGDGAKGGLGSDPFPCSTTDSVQVAFRLPRTVFQLLPKASDCLTMRVQTFC
jgi:hypothetical protein